MRCALKEKISNYSRYLDWWTKCRHRKLIFYSAVQRACGVHQRKTLESKSASEISSWRSASFSTASAFRSVPVMDGWGKLDIAGWGKLDIGGWGKLDIAGCGKPAMACWGMPAIDGWAMAASGDWSKPGMKLCRALVSWENGFADFMASGLTEAIGGRAGILPEDMPSDRGPDCDGNWLEASWWSFDASRRCCCCCCCCCCCSANIWRLFICCWKSSCCVWWASCCWRSWLFMASLLLAWFINESRPILREDMFSCGSPRKLELAFRVGGHRSVFVLLAAKDWPASMDACCFCVVCIDWRAEPAVPNASREELPSGVDWLEMGLIIALETPPLWKQKTKKHRQRWKKIWERH